MAPPDVFEDALPVVERYPVWGYPPPTATTAETLPEMIDELIREGSLSLPDPLAAGAYYRLYVRPQLLVHTVLGTLCICWPVYLAGDRHRDRELVTLSFGTIIAAICAGVPVSQIRNGEWIPGPVGGDDPACSALREALGRFVAYFEV